jgi:tetratricopeptide (TPR) repeat protein
MSVNLQRNLRQNVAEMHDYVNDLYKWTDEVATKGPKTHKIEKSQVDIPIRGQAYTEELVEAAQDKLKNAKVDKSMLRKDKIPLVDYYKNWDKVDVEEALKDTDAAPVSNVVTEAFSENKGKDKSKGVGLQVVGGTRKRVSALDDIKNDGNEYYRQREYVKAIEKYSEALVKDSLTQNTIDNDMQTFDQNIDIYLSLLTNRAQCFMNQQEFSKGLKDCNKAISIKNDYAKAYFRKSQILKRMDDWRGAHQAILEGIQWAPQDASFKKELANIDIKIKEIKSQLLNSMVVYG